jgi:hypothetical protein
MKVICPVCEKVVSAYVPRGGDGSALRPYRHGNCEGRFELVVEIYEMRLPTQRATDLPLATMCECGAVGYESHKRWCPANTASR